MQSASKGNHTDFCHKLSQDNIWYDIKVHRSKKLNIIAFPLFSARIHSFKIAPFCFFPQTQIVDVFTIFVVFNVYLCECWGKTVYFS